MDETMDKKRPLSDLMRSTMDKIREMADTNTIVGQPITTPDGVTLIPISRVSMGFGCGGADYGKTQPKDFGGGSGAGVKIEPVAFLVIREGDLNDVVTVSREAAYTEGSSMYLKVGEKLTLETLLYGLLLCSGNDAAVAIAEHISGSQEDFAKLMNATAREIGMEHSSFANPNGLDHEDHYSTARDMARLACAAVENETLVRMASTRSVTIGGRTMTNHNKLLNQIEGCIGLKTGYTMAAGRTLVSCVERNGQRLVAVTLQDGNDWADHAALYDYGFSTYPAKLGASLGQTIQRVQVENGMSATVPLVAADSFAWPLAEGESLELDVELAGSLRAPIRAGRRAGEAVFSVNGKEVGRVALLYGADVAPRMESALSILKQGLPG